MKTSKSPGKRLRFPLLFLPLLVLAAVFAACVTEPAPTEPSENFVAHDFVFRADENDPQHRLVVLGYQGNDRDITVPSTVGGVPVYRVGERAFADGAFSSVTLGVFVEEIGDAAFSGDSALASVCAEDALRTIGDGAF